MSAASMAGGSAGATNAPLPKSLFGYEVFERLGYNIAVHGQKTYNGVALLSKAPLEDVRRWASFTTVPRPLHGLYARFDHRSILPTALSAEDLTAVVGAPAAKLDGLPYLVAVWRSPAARST